MFIVLLKFSTNKSQAGDFMEGHKEWLKRGFDDGIFILAGSLKPGLGGGIIAHGITRTDLLARVDQDPFVMENIVTADVLEIEPSRIDERLGFLAV